jgi:NADH dehydrogenase
MAGLEPSSISFPLRKVFHDHKNIHVRITAVNAVNTSIKQLSTDIGVINYDFLVLAMGADTNYYGQQNIMKNAMPMKSISEAIYLRNRVLQNFDVYGGGRWWPYRCRNFRYHCRNAKNHLAKRLPRIGF